jgi:hypothetical protein
MASVISAPSGRSFAVTPNDTTAIPVGRALLVGAAGAVTGQLLEDTVDTVFTLPAGVAPLRFKLIKATGTTATGLVVLF